MSHRKFPLWLGCIALAFYIAHAVELALYYPVVNLAWSCNVASVFIAFGLLAQHATANSVGCVMLNLGNIFWLIDISTGGTFLVTSLFTHVGLCILSFMGMKTLGLPKGTWRKAIGVMFVLTVVTGWLGTPGENVNLAHRIPAGYETMFPSHGVYVLAMTLLFAVLAFSLELSLLNFLGFPTPEQAHRQRILLRRQARLKEQEKATAAQKASDENPKDTSGAEPKEPNWSEEEKTFSDWPTSEHPSVIKYAKHVNPAFVKLLGMLKYGRLFMKGRDVWLWDHQGNRYLDCLAGFGAVNIGHSHPRLHKRLQTFLEEEALNFIHVGPSVHMGNLAAKLASLNDDPLNVVTFCNTGAEAVEGGMKIARAATGRSEYIYCEGAYHGTSMGTLSVMGEQRMREPFEPLLSGCHMIPMGNLEALENLLKDKKIAAFVVDPGLCEVGLITPPPGFLKAAQALCHKYGSLLLLDEVQTGLGRTGTMFAYQQEGFVPDIMALAKSLSGGLAPIGVTITTEAIHDKCFGSAEHFDLNNTTFGGNSFSCIAALETLNILCDEKLAENSKERGQELLEGLQKRLAGHPLVQEIRGRGLLLSIDLGPTDQGMLNKLAPDLVKMISKEVFGQWVAVKLLEKGILCQPATQHWDRLKLEPPLTIQSQEIQFVIEKIGEVFDEYQGIPALLQDVSGRVGEQFIANWSF